MSPQNCSISFKWATSGGHCVEIIFSKSPLIEATAFPRRFTSVHTIPVTNIPFTVPNASQSVVMSPWCGLVELRVVGQSSAESSCVLSHSSLSAAGFFFCGPGAGRRPALAPPVPGPPPHLCVTSQISLGATALWCGQIVTKGGTWRARGTALATLRGEGAGKCVSGGSPQRQQRGDAEARCEAGSIPGVWSSHPVVSRVDQCAAAYISREARLLISCALYKPLQVRNPMNQLLQWLFTVSRIIKKKKKKHSTKWNKGINKGKYLLFFCKNRKTASDAESWFNCLDGKPPIDCQALIHDLTLLSLNLESPQ